ncbi:MAG: hypothetical protein MJA28_03385 [Gammaproteobacteria bacterium]|nr:hypothetical protein [Gammaproteobacteria bacterium]
MIHVTGQPLFQSLGGDIPGASDDELLRVRPVFKLTVGPQIFHRVTPAILQYLIAEPSELPRFRYFEMTFYVNGLATF